MKEHIYNFIGVMLFIAAMVSNSVSLGGTLCVMAVVMFIMADLQKENEFKKNKLNG